MSNHGIKPKQVNLPIALYHRIIKRCGEVQDTNETRVIIKLIEKGLESPPEIVDLPEVEPLFPDDEGDRDQPEIIRLRKVFPNDEPEVQRQLKEIEQGLKDAGIAEEDIRLTLYGPEK